MTQAQQKGQNIEETAGDCGVNSLDEDSTAAAALVKYIHPSVSCIFNKIKCIYLHLS